MQFQRKIYFSSLYGNHFGNYVKTVFNNNKRDRSLKTAKRQKHI